MKKLLLSCLLTLTGFAAYFAAYTAEKTKNETSQSSSLDASKLPELLANIQTHIISFLPNNYLEKLQQARLVNPEPILDKTLTGHAAAIESIAYSPDGSQLASGSADTTVKIWNSQTGVCLHTLTGHTSAIESIAYSPHGSKLASASCDQTIKIWNIQTEACLHTLTGHTDAITSIAYSPDGLHLASGSADTTVKIWNPQTGELLHTLLTGHSKWILSIAYSPNGSQLASGLWYKTIKIWDVIPKITLYVRQNALFFKITQTTLAWKNAGTLSRLYFNNPKDEATFLSLPERIQKILTSVIYIPSFETFENSHTASFGSSSSHNFLKKIFNKIFKN